ncbi:MAG TPA: gamma carbonic anhydrase family protein [Croceibacterium sp.]|nr:gamma carbonic anhydrase family protein [Croceibacterium sp.]
MSPHPGATIITYGGKTPHIHETAFIAPGARLIGDIEVGPQASVWYNCVLRGDLNRIVIGARSNVQDGTVIHVEDGAAGEPGLPTLIGEDALIGHMAILHGCVVEDRGFVGMGSVAMDGSRIASEAMLAAGALLSPGKVLPSGELWAGRPARPVRSLTPDQRKQMQLQSAKYLAMAEAHRRALAQ